MQHFHMQAHNYRAAPVTLNGMMRYDKVDNVGPILKVEKNVKGVGVGKTLSLAIVVKVDYVLCEVGLFVNEILLKCNWRNELNVYTKRKIDLQIKKKINFG